MKLALVGYGKMGKAVQDVALERGHQVVARIDPTLDTGEIGAEALGGADVAIEFTVPDAAVDNITALAAAGVDGVSISLCAAKAPLETPLDHAAVRSCIKALESAGLPPETTSVAFGTDAGPFAEAGLPGVVLGPGSIEQAHTSREFIETAQVDAATRLFEALLSGETPSE